MTSGTVTTRDGTRIYCKGWGSGQPIVFHHGWPLSSDDWNNQMLLVDGSPRRCCGGLGHAHHAQDGPKSGWPAAFDVRRFGAALAANRAQFFLDVPTGPFHGFNRPAAQVSQGPIQTWWRQGMTGGAKPQ